MCAARSTPLELPSTPRVLGCNTSGAGLQHIDEKQEDMCPTGILEEPVSYFLLTQSRGYSLPTVVFCPLKGTVDTCQSRAYASPRMLFLPLVPRQVYNKA